MADHDATEEIADVVRSITTLMVRPSRIGVDFDDLRVVLARPGHDGPGRRSVFGEGEASGEDRAIRAADLAIAALRDRIAGAR